MFFERRCPACGGRSPALCSPCRRWLVPAPPLPPPAGLDGLTAWCCYDGVGRALVLALKHGGRRDLARWLGVQLAPLAPDVDAVAWVPASVSGRRQRGYDQGQLLARAVGRAVDRPVASLLRRPSRSASQRGRGRDQRLEGVALSARRPAPPRVLLVDDVTTTGASLRHGAQAMRRAGATRVHGLVVAIADRDLSPGRGDPVGAWPAARP